MSWFHLAFLCIIFVILLALLMVPSSKAKKTKPRPKSPKRDPNKVYTDPGPVRKATCIIVCPHGCGEVRWALVCDEHIHQPRRDDYFDGHLIHDDDPNPLREIDKGKDCRYCAKSYRIVPNGKRSWDL